MKYQGRRERVGNEIFEATDMAVKKMSTAVSQRLRSGVNSLQCIADRVIKSVAQVRL